MSDAKLRAASELIREENYPVARAVLKTIPNDPMAQKWLARLDEVAPLPRVELRPPAPPPKRSSSRWLILLTVVILLVGGYLIWQRIRYNQYADRITESVVALSLLCEYNTRNPDAVCAQWAQRVINEDVARVDAVGVCEFVAGRGSYIVDPGAGQAFASCLARHNIYLPGV